MGLCYLEFQGKIVRIMLDMENYKISSLALPKAIVNTGISVPTRL